MPESFVRRSYACRKKNSHSSSEPTETSPVMNTLKELPRTLLVLLVLIFSLNIASAAEPVQPSGRTVVAEVVAFDQAFLLNRLGSALDTPRIFAVRRDVGRQAGPALPGDSEKPSRMGCVAYVRRRAESRARR